MVEGKEIIILNFFAKESQKTPKKELDLAKKRMKEIKNEPSHL
jgi:phage-related protein